MNHVTLYQLAAEYRADLNKLADLDLDPNVINDTLEGMGGDLQEKAQNVVAFVRNLESTAAAIKEAEAGMAARRKAMENRAASIKRYVLDVMVHNKIQRIDCPLFAITLAKNPPAVDVYDERSIPADYFIEPPPPPPQVDKRLIAKAISDGFTVPGARLTQGVRLTIK